VGADIARMIVLRAAWAGIAKLADVDAVGAIVAALAVTRQIVDRIGAAHAHRAVAAVGRVQDADRPAAIVALILLLRTNLDATAGPRYSNADLRHGCRRAGDQQQDCQPS